MRTFPLLLTLICLLCPVASQAELRIIAVLVTKDSQSTTRVSIYSDVEKENKTNVTVFARANIPKVFKLFFYYFERSYSLRLFKRDIGV